MKKILIVDDHPLTREGTALALRGLPEPLSMLEADSLAMAFSLLVQGDVELMLLDLDLGATRGIETLRLAHAWLEREGLDTRILVLSGMPEPTLVHEALEHFASGFVSKAARRESLIDAVSTTLAGGVFLPREDARRGCPNPNAHASEAAAMLGRLTARERDVAGLLIKGLTYKRIALKLQARDGKPVSDQTVRAHVGNIAWKLGVQENAKAGVMARIAELGLLFDERGASVRTPRGGV